MTDEEMINLITKTVLENIDKYTKDNSKNKKKKDFSKKVVAGVIMMNIVFTAVIFLLFLKVGSEPVALITAWFSFTTIELWSLSNITKKKIEKGE